MSLIEHLDSLALARMKELESRIVAQAAEIKGFREALEKIVSQCDGYCYRTAREALAKKEWSKE